jgi:hypothetical protein
VRRSASQPYTTYLHLMWEYYYKPVRKLILRSAKEGGKMMWDQIVVSLICVGIYKGLHVMDLSGLVDNTNNITFEHSECRNDETYFDVINELHLS